MSKNTQLGNLVNGIYVDSTGKVGVGTTSPSVALDVVGAGKFSTTVTAQTGLKLPANGNGTSPTLAYNNSLGFGVSGTGIFFGNLYNSDLSTAMQLRVTNSGGTDITAMTITPTGNVGIGTTSTNEALSIVRPANSASYLSVFSGTSYVLFGVDSAGLPRIYTDSNPISFWTNGTERMRITSGGNVLIGTTSDNGSGALLQVGGFISGTTFSASLSLTVNANNEKKSGLYRWNNDSSNLPEAGFFSVVIYGNCDNVVAQMATHFTNANTYVRAFNSSWTAWRRII